MSNNIHELKISLDTAWILIMGLFVFFMNSGFAMLETGFCRVKNAVNLLSKNLSVFFLSSFAFWVLRFSIMFGKASQYIGIKSAVGLFLSKHIDFYSALKGIDIPLEALFFFQMVFAGTAATIISGAIAERTKFISFLIFTFFMTSLIYPIAGHWLIGKGILYQIGVRDFAGSLMVHTVGGISALAGAIVVGQRVGKYNKDLSPNAILGHSLPMITLGGFIMWLGWFGFNLGCTFGFSPKLCAHIALCTNASGVMGGLSAMFLSWYLLRKPDLSMTINGLLGGLVASTGTCAFVSLQSAHIIGFIAGILVVISILLFERFVHIDDPVGAISVHGVGGIWGALAVGLFASNLPLQYGRIPHPEPGLFFGGGTEQLVTQMLGIGSIVWWAFTSSFIVWVLLKHTIGIRVSQTAEVDGLDVAEHGMEAYPGFSGSGEGLL